MHLRPNELVFGGVAPEIILDWAQQLRDGERPISLDAFSRALGAPLDEAAPVLEEMVRAGILEQRGDGTFDRTVKFTQLAAASISEGLPRSQAENLLQRVVARAQQINERPPADFTCRVDCIVVFGSYLTGKAILGDLDLGVGTRELRQGPRKSPVNIMRLLSLQSPTGRVFSELRLRKPKLISIHSLQEVLEMNTPFKVVFGQLPESTGNSGGLAP